MLQAFYSRSSDSIVERLSSLGLNEGSIRKSLRSYYIGYGHQSIGDCGSYTLFIEGVSILTAKAIQDNPLYAGQETSSRYIDFGGQDLRGSADDWLHLYKHAVKVLPEYLSGQDTGLSPKALQVKAFDIARGLLPASAMTQLSWHGSIQSIRTHLAKLLQHPLSIVRHDAEAIHAHLKDASDLFTELPDPEPHDWYLDTHSAPDFSVCPLWINAKPDMATTETKLLGSSHYMDNLDYGSYRDIQRHRPAYIKSTPPSQWLGPNTWYLDQLPPHLAKQVEYQWDYHDINPENAPLMSKVLTLVHADIKQFAYMFALRTSPTVHPTLRTFMMKMQRAFVGEFANLEAVFPVNPEEAMDYAKRATQDIKRVKPEG